MELGRLSFIKNIKPSVTLVLWILLLAVLALDGFTVLRSYKLFNRAINQDPGIQTSRSARINFESYEAAVSRIGGADTYVPRTPPLVNPFVSAGRK